MSSSSPTTTKKIRESIAPGVAAAAGPLGRVIGAGIMGAGIVAANLRRKVPVAVTDAAEPALADGVRHVLEEVSYNKQTKGPDAERAIRFAPLLNATDVRRRAGPGRSGDRGGGRKPRREKGALRPAGAAVGRPTPCWLRTPRRFRSPSWLKGLKRPDRFIGIHFFNPVRKMPLVEVIRGRETSDETVATAVAYAKSIGKSPIVVHDGPGFLVNRLLFPYLNESLELLGEGAPIKAIERAATDFGMPMGPLALVRHGRARHVGLRRPRDVGSVSRSDRRLADSAGHGQGGPAGPEERPRVLPLSRQEGAQRARSDAGRLAGHLSPRRAQVQPRGADPSAAAADGAGSDADSRGPSWCATSATSTWA